MAENYQVLKSWCKRSSSKYFLIYYDKQIIEKMYVVVEFYPSFVDWMEADLNESFEVNCKKETGFGKDLFLRKKLW